MTIILSCGHKVDDMDDAINVVTKEWARDSERAVGYSTVCKNCYYEYEANGDLLLSEQDELNWLAGL